MYRNTCCLNIDEREYTHSINASSGFSNELDEQLLNDAKMPTLEDYQKYVGLLGDEMYIREGLVYDKNLIGYCDLGDINNHLLRLEHKTRQAKYMYLSINKDGFDGERPFY